MTIGDPQTKEAPSVIARATSQLLQERTTTLMPGAGVELIGRKTRIARGNRDRTTTVRTSPKKTGEERRESVRRRGSSGIAVGGGGDGLRQIVLLEVRGEVSRHHGRDIERQEDNAIKTEEACLCYF